MSSNISPIPGSEPPLETISEGDFDVVVTEQSIMHVLQECKLIRCGHAHTRSSVWLYQQQRQQNASASFDRQVQRL